MCVYGELLSLGLRQLLGDSMQSRSFVITAMKQHIFYNVNDNINFEDWLKNVVKYYIHDIENAYYYYHQHYDHYYYRHYYHYYYHYLPEA